MNRKRWAPLAAIVAALVAMIAVVAGVLQLTGIGPAAGPPGPESRHAFAFDAAYADADPMMLVVRYGDSSSCPSEAVRHDVVQQPGRVMVTLTRTPIPANQACTADYGARLVRIALTAPLGGREVVDGSRKQPVPISTGLPPLG
jgi:hypothetical protein